MLVFDETSSDISALIEADFGAIDPTKEFLRVFLDWLHYRTRRITQRPRQVIMSTEVRGKLGDHPTIRIICRELRTGSDLGPWLSDSIRRKIRNPKADLMFNDWQIMHFHLGRTFVNPRKIKRSDDLLFAYIGTKHAVLLDIKPHRRQTWMLHSLLEILLRTNASDMERFELKGVLGSKNRYTADEVLELRKVGLSTYCEVSGRYFIPGLGLSTSGHSTRIVLSMQRLLRQIKDLRQSIERNQLPAPLLRQLAGSLPLPIRLGIRLEKDDFVIFEKNRRLDFVRHPM
jgi:hypothetical protein